MVSKNAPCPCGSGKKYKRCCLGQSQPVTPPGAPLSGMKTSQNADLPDDVPIMDEDGLRYVSFSQALIDYSLPLLGGEVIENKGQAELIMSLGQLCWGLAVKERTGQDKALRDKIRPGLDEIGVTNVDGFLDNMVHRHEQMFPRLVEDQGASYLRQKFLDPREPWRQLNGETLNLPKAGFIPTEMDEDTLTSLGEWDRVVAEGDSAQVFDRFLEARGRLDETFDAWLGTAALEDGPRANFREAVFQLLTFHHQNQRSLAPKPETDLGPFLTRWLFRKVKVSGTTHGGAPLGLTLLGRYLEAVGYGPDLEARFLTALEPVQKPLKGMLSLYYGEPSSPPILEDRGRGESKGNGKGIRG